MVFRQQRGQPLAKCCCRCKRWMMRLAKAASNGCPEDGRLTRADAPKFPAGLLWISMILIMYERCWYVWYPYDPYGICIFTCMIVLEIVVACCDCDVAFNKFIEWAWSIWLFAWSIQLLRSFNGMTSLPCAATAEDIAQSERNWSPTRKRVGYQRPQEGQSKLEELTDYRNQEVIWGAMRYHEVLVFWFSICLVQYFDSWVTWCGCRWKSIQWTFRSPVAACADNLMPGLIWWFISA